MATDIIARGMITEHTDNSDIHVTVSDKENWNSHPNDVMSSGNPVQIDGLQGGVPFSEMVVSGKNLIERPYYVVGDRTFNGITFTDNGDGTITANGTATDRAIYFIRYREAFKLRPGNYVLSGCPVGGSNTTYYMWLGIWDGTSNIYGVFDLGNSTIVTITEDMLDKYLVIGCYVYTGYTADNITFRPQLELGTEATAYEPPITGRNLTVEVSGKNLISGNIIKRTATVTDNSDSWIIEWTAAMLVRFDKIFLKPNTDYTISWWQKSDNGTDCVRIGVVNGDNESSIIEQSSAEIKTGTEYTLCSFTFNSGNNRNIYVQFLRASITGTVYVKKSIQLELGDTATEYEPYHGSTTTITPDSNPYVIPNDIRQQDGYNVVSVSEGEISVTGVRKNAAVKKIWDKMGMDLLFDGVTSADNPAVIDLANYNMIRIDAGGNYEGTSYFNCGSTYFSKSTLDYAVTSYGSVAMSISNQAVIINISKSGADYSLSFTGFNTKQLVDVIKIYGIK